MRDVFHQNTERFPLLYFASIVEIVIPSQSLNLNPELHAALVP